jgi:hypothetical protein
VVQSRKSTRNIPRRGRRSGKGENIIINQPLHNILNIPTTIVIIETLMAKQGEILKTTLKVEPKEL